MDAELFELHVRVGSIMNKDHVCGKKIDYKSEERATQAAASMNKKIDRLGYHELEPYPCAYCKGWHIGRKMSFDELSEYASEIK